MHPLNPLAWVEGPSSTTWLRVLRTRYESSGFQASATTLWDQNHVYLGDGDDQRFLDATAVPDQHLIPDAYFRVPRNVRPVTPCPASPHSDRQHEGPSC